MYNNVKRTTLTKDGVIVIAGQKSWIPVGRYEVCNKIASGWIAPISNGFIDMDQYRKGECYFFEDITKSELRKIALKRYNDSHTQEAI
jgi:hypothetical protein